MTDQFDPAKLRELHEAATPGPWEAHQGVLAEAPLVWDITSRHEWSDNGMTPQGWFLATVHEVSAPDSATHDAALIVALRNAVPDILAQADENSALKARVVQLEKALLCYACECGPDQIAICRRLDRDDCGWAAKECFGGTREGVRAARSAALAGGDHD